MAKVDVGDTAPDFELPGHRGQDLPALRLPRPQAWSSPSTPATSPPSAPSSSAPTATTASGSTSSAPRCSGSRRSRSTRTSASTEEQELNVPLLADEDSRPRLRGDRLARPTGVAHRARRTVGGRYVSARSSSSTARGSSATARSRCTGATYESVDDLERAVAAIGLMPPASRRQLRGRRRRRRSAARRRGRGRRSSSATGSPRPAATSSTARGRWSAPGTG